MRESSQIRRRFLFLGLSVFFLFPRRRTTTAGWAMDRGEDLDDIADRRGRNGVEQAGRGHRACG